MRINTSALNCETCKKIRQYASPCFTADTLLLEAIKVLKQADKSDEIRLRSIRWEGFEVEYGCVACHSRWIISIPDDHMGASLEWIPTRGERPPCIMTYPELPGLRKV